MSTLYIEAKVLAGTGINNAVVRAIRLAGRLGVPIEINFNGCLLYVHCSDNVGDKVQEYEQFLKSPKEV